MTKRHCVPCMIGPALLVMLAALGAATSSMGVARTSLVLSSEAAAPECQAATCLRADQVVPWYTAWQMKRDLHRQAFLLDARAVPRTGSGSLLPAFDAWVPFVEYDGGPLGAGGMRFRSDFATRVDDAIRNQGLGSTDPIIVLCDTTQCGELAALLLQERGYPSLYVVAGGARAAAIAKASGP